MKDLRNNWEDLSDKEKKYVELFTDSVLRDLKEIIKNIKL